MDDTQNFDSDYTIIFFCINEEKGIKIIYNYRCTLKSIF